MGGLGLGWEGRGGRGRTGCGGAGQGRAGQDSPLTRLLMREGRFSRPDGEEASHVGRADSGARALSQRVKRCIAFESVGSASPCEYLTRHALRTVLIQRCRPCLRRKRRAEDMCLLTKHTSREAGV